MRLLAGLLLFAAGLSAQSGETFKRLPPMPNGVLFKERGLNRLAPVFKSLPPNPACSVEMPHAPIPDDADTMPNVKPRAGQDQSREVTPRGKCPYRLLLLAD